MEGAAVSFRLPEEGPGGTFSRGTRTEIQITGPDGRAGFREFIAGHASGPFQVRVTAARDSIRAGTIIDQYISEATDKAASAGPHHAKSLLAPGEKASSSRRWMIWVAVGGGAAAAAFAASAMGHGGSASTPASAAAPRLPAPVIGVPVISIGGAK